MNTQDEKPKKLRKKRDVNNEFLYCPDIDCPYLTIVTSNLRKHVLKEHNDEPNLYACKEHDCAYKCNSKLDLLHHLTVSFIYYFV